MRNSKEITLEFYECEHEGDLNNYKSDIVKCGGKIISAFINTHAELGTVIFSVEDQQAFTKCFKETDSYEFIN